MFHVDVTDMFMASRRACVVTAVTGRSRTWSSARSPSSSLRLGGKLHAGLRGGVLGIIQVEARRRRANPNCFIEMDGYHVLVDVPVWTLKHDVIAYGGSYRRGAGQGQEELLWLGYVVLLKPLGLVAFIVFNVWIIFSATH